MTPRARYTSVDAANGPGTGLGENRRNTISSSDAAALAINTTFTRFIRPIVSATRNTISPQRGATSRYFRNKESARRAWFGGVASDRGLENQPVIVAVKIPGDNAVGNLIPSRGVEHESAQNRLLGFDRMRRQAQAVSGADGTIADASGHAQS
jgi:hypothetical protein